VSAQAPNYCPAVSIGFVEPSSVGIPSPVLAFIDSQTLGLEAHAIAVQLSSTATSYDYPFGVSWIGTRQYDSQGNTTTIFAKNARVTYTLEQLSFDRSSSLTLIDSQIIFQEQDLYSTNTTVSFFGEHSVSGLSPDTLYKLTLKITAEEVLPASPQCVPAFEGASLEATAITYISVGNALWKCFSSASIDSDVFFPTIDYSSPIVQSTEILFGESAKTLRNIASSPDPLSVVLHSSWNPASIQELFSLAQEYQLPNPFQVAVALTYRLNWLNPPVTFYQETYYIDTEDTSLSGAFLKSLSIPLQNSGIIQMSFTSSAFLENNELIQTLCNTSSEPLTQTKNVYFFIDTAPPDDPPSDPEASIFITATDPSRNAFHFEDTVNLEFSADVSGIDNVDSSKIRWELIPPEAGTLSSDSGFFTTFTNDKAYLSTNPNDITIQAKYLDFPYPLSDPLNLTSFTIESILWQKKKDSSGNPVTILENNTNWGGGKRIYPCRVHPDEDDEVAALRRTIDIVAKIKPELEGVPLYFKAFDIDDLTESEFLAGSGSAMIFDAKLVDPNDDYTTSGQLNVVTVPRGGDNYEVFASAPITCIEIFNSNTDGLREGYREVFTQGGAENLGTARATLRKISLQPGDNYRIGVDFSDRIQMVTDDEVPANNDLEADSVLTSQPLNGKYSEMLTVWRKLHIEYDSMNTPPSDHPQWGYNVQIDDVEIDSTEAKIGGKPPKPWIKLTCTPHHPSIDLDELEGGICDIEGVGKYFIIKSAILIKRVDASPIPTIGGPYIIVATFTVTIAPRIEIDPSASPVPILTKAFLMGKRIHVIDDDDNTLLPRFLNEVKPNETGSGNDFVGNLTPYLKSRFAYAFITPEDLNTVERLNSAQENDPTTLYDFNRLMTKYSYNEKRDVSSKYDYWTHLLITAFEPERTDDNDPDLFAIDNKKLHKFLLYREATDGEPVDTASTRGITPSFYFSNSNISLIYLETAKETANEVPLERVVAHELGHRVFSPLIIYTRPLGSAHIDDVNPTYGCLMRDGLTGGYDYFNAYTINLLRQVLFW
jgi:hypothetical protein